MDDHNDLPTHDDEPLTGLLGEAVTQVRADQPPAAAEERAVERALDAIPRPIVWSPRRRRLALAALAASLIGMVWAGLAWRDGKFRLARSNQPSPYYMYDGVDYVPSGDFSLSTEAAALEEESTWQAIESQVQEPLLQGAGTQYNRSAHETRPFVTNGGVSREVIDRDHGPGATVGMDVPTEFGTDLDLPFEQEGFDTSGPAVAGAESESDHFRFSTLGEAEDSPAQAVTELTEGPTETSPAAAPFPDAAEGDSVHFGDGQSDLASGGQQGESGEGQGQASQQGAAGFPGGAGGPPGGAGGIPGGAGGLPRLLGTAGDGSQRSKERLADSRGMIGADEVGFGEVDFSIGQPRTNRENYARIYDNPFFSAAKAPVSTFSIDVDTASYSNVRRFLTRNTLPPPDAVRIEELVNYFSYDYAPPQDGEPFAVHTEVVGCPWQPGHRLLRVGIKGRVVADEERKSGNLVFLLDVSGSMNEPNKLPLVKSAMALLVDRLGENDRVGIVVYAGAAGVVLPPTTGDRKREILSAIEQLHAGGSTNGGEGIRLAYDLAVENFINGGVNRVILCTDGDFNVGVSGQGELERLIEEKAQSGVFLSVLGFGEGNLQDAKMEGLADRGNGNYAYVDGLREARKVFVEQLSGTLETIAKDVKIQIEFNPAEVAGYRLIGYENRLLRTEDFNDDKKDAGEIGAGHTVTALYEIVPVRRAEAEDAAAKGDDDVPRREDGEPAVDLPADPPEDRPAVEPLKYQVPAQLSPAAAAGELLTLRLRFKQPDGATSVKREFAVRDEGAAYGQASADTRFAAAVAGFGMLLRGSRYRGTLTWEGTLELAQEGVGDDPHGYRAEFVELVRAAARLSPQ